MKTTQTPHFLIAGYDDAQVTCFLRKHRIPRQFAHRVYSVENVQAWSNTTLVILPGITNPHVRDAVADFRARMHRRSNRIVQISESTLRDSREGPPPCANDTDHDGNCHLCHRHGGCPWPDAPSKPVA